jgi:hypothetical protein
MAEQFNDQGGLAGMDPNPLLRWLTGLPAGATAKAAAKN